MSYLPYAILAWLALINLLTWHAFAKDKHASVRGKRRVPERRMLWMAGLGGAPAALAATRVLKHKTRKEPFRTRLLMIAGAELAVLVGLVAWMAGWIG